MDRTPSGCSVKNVLLGGQSMTAICETCLGMAGRFTRKPPSIPIEYELTS